MHAQWYNETLRALKGLEGQDSEKQSVHLVDMSQIKGVQQHRLEALFPGKDARLYKIQVEKRQGGKFRFAGGLELPFDLNNLTCCWAKPGSKALYCLLVPGYTGMAYRQNLHDLGLEIKSSEKLFKRLKRAMCPLTEGASHEFDFCVLQGQPEKMTDGFGWANSEFLARISNQNIHDGDLFTYSMLTERGMSKGTLVASDRLATEVAISNHNLKPELATIGSRHFWLESRVLHHKPASTDIQTLINTTTWRQFEKCFDQELEHLVKMAMDGNFAQKWFEENFEEQDWYQHYLKSLTEAEREELRPELESSAPRLTLAFKAGLDLRVSPVLRRQAFYYLARGVNIRKMRVPIPEGARRAYAIPQLDQFDPTTGAFCPNPTTVMERDEIMFPGAQEYQEIACVRQPNALGEAVIAYNVPQLVKSTGVQMSPLACDASLAEVYGLKACEQSVLEIHGGMDWDDTLLCYTNTEVIQRVRRRLKQIKGHQIPPANLEQLIDGDVQSGQSQFDQWSQIHQATRKTPITLGRGVNHLLALTAIGDWKNYGRAALATNPLELAFEESLYIRDYGNYPDAWMYQERGTRDNWSRIPWNFELNQFEEATPVKTRLGDIMARCGLKMDHLYRSVKDSLDINNESWICSPLGMEFLQSCQTHEGRRGLHIAEALAAIWHKMTGQDPFYQGPHQELVDQYPVVQREDKIPLRDKIDEWCVVVGELYNECTHEEGITATARLAEWLLQYRRRWDEELGRYRLAWGKDSLLWNQALEAVRSTLTHEVEYQQRWNQDGTHCQGPRDYWIAILAQFSRWYVDNELK